MSDQHCVVLNWNVWGLNNQVRRQVVRDLASQTRCTIARLQEIRMAGVDEQVVRDTLGDSFCRSCAMLQAQETRGGALLAVHENAYSIIQSFTLEFSVTAELQSTTSVDRWWLRVVYGPQGESDKLRFLQEVRQIKQLVAGAWLILGDFNLILSAEDKSNSNLNRRLMGSFKSVIDDLELRELPLKGRKFTWSNDVTHTRIDRGFYTAE
jgi:exonuclease III